MVLQQHNQWIQDLKKKSETWKQTEDTACLQWRDQGQKENHHARECKLGKKTDRTSKEKTELKANWVKG